MTISIRFAAPSDLAAMAAIFRTAALSDSAARDLLLARPDLLDLDPAIVAGDTALVAVQPDGNVAGFANWIADDDAWEVDGIFVHPDHWQRGIGRALIAQIAALAAERQIESLQVLAAAGAHGFYLATGFAEIGREPTELGAEAIRMRKRLDTAHRRPGA